MAAESGGAAGLGGHDAHAVQPDEPKESWGDAQREALYQGLERFGVGKWREMIDHFPPLARYGDTDLRAHAARLLGTQSLARHVGWKGGRAAVEAERTKHLRIGRELGCIKNGVLVEDDAGSVAAYFEAHPVEDPSQQQQQQQQQRQRQQGAG
eukprot:scaffold12.g7952.t1